MKEGWIGLWLGIDLVGLGFKGERLDCEMRKFFDWIWFEIG